MYDEWNNVEETIEHLYNVQAARCHEFSIYSRFLSYKYPLAPVVPLVSFSILIKVPSSKITIVPITNLGISNKEKVIYDTKRNRMIKAKKDYEYAGGQQLKSYVRVFDKLILVKY